MDDPNWAQVLRALYRAESAYGIQKENEFSEGDYLVDESGLKPEQVREGIRFLESQNLVEMNHEEILDPETFEVAEEKRILRITSEGFEVAQHRELRRRENNTNRAVALLTGILGFTALLQGAIAYIDTPMSWTQEVIVGVIILCIVGLLVPIWYQIGISGLLNMKT
ncbi:hypothetical protein [Halosimplex sp. J119]